MSPCPCNPSDSVWCLLPHFGDGNRKEGGGRKARLIKRSHHSGCLLVTHHPVSVAVPTWLAGVGGGAPGGYQGGDWSSVRPRENMGGQGKLKPKAWHLVPGYVWVLFSEGC